MATPENHGEFQHTVMSKERRRLKARKEEKSSIWQGFGVFGLVGWSVAAPTVVFVMIGMWLDQRFPSSRSYTLALLIAGLLLGCVNAWYWVRQKVKEIEDSEENEEVQEENPKTHD